LPARLAPVIVLLLAAAPGRVPPAATACRAPPDVEVGWTHVAHIAVHAVDPGTCAARPRTANGHGHPSVHTSLGTGRRGRHPLEHPASATRRPVGHAAVPPLHVARAGLDQEAVRPRRRAVRVRRGSPGSKRVASWCQATRARALDDEDFEPTAEGVGGVEEWVGAAGAGRRCRRTTDDLEPHDVAALIGWPVVDGARRAHPRPSPTVDGHGPGVAHSR